MLVGDLEPRYGEEVGTRDACEGGVSPVCCVCVKQEKAPCSRAGGAGRGAGGPIRSSDEALVMGVERRGRVVRDVFMLVNQEDWEELG